jgi:hypothetical protein
VCGTVTSTTWAASSAGRAPRSQRGGREFEPPAVHQIQPHRWVRGTTAQNPRRRVLAPVTHRPLTTSNGSVSLIARCLSIPDTRRPWEMLPDRRVRRRAAPCARAPHPTHAKQDPVNAHLVLLCFCKHVCKFRIDDAPPSHSSSQRSSLPFCCRLGGLTRAIDALAGPQVDAALNAIAATSLVWTTRNVSSPAIRRSKVGYASARVFAPCRYPGSAVASGCA